jgi:hypothetical protein
MKNFFTFLVISTILIACEENAVEENKTVSIVSTGEIDGTISNFSPKVFTDYFGGGQGSELRIGWELNGEAMRAFLSFDMSSILPSADEKIEISKAYLKVYESNTNLLPFTAEGSRTVEAYMLDGGTDIESSDYDALAFANCGTIATTGYSVLTEHAVNIKTALINYLDESNYLIDHVEFRLQFIGDDNVVFADPRAQSYFAIFSGDESSYLDYRPVIEIEYTIKPVK